MSITKRSAASKVVSQGLQFGFWFRPVDMASPQSGLPERHFLMRFYLRYSAFTAPPGFIVKPLPGNAVKRFDKQKNSKIKTSQSAIQAWKADTSSAGAVRPRNSADDSQRPGWADT